MNLFQTLLSKVSRSPLHVYTDGSCKDGRGAWAYVVVKKGVVISEASGFERSTNSLSMEFRAAIEGLRSLGGGTTAVVFSDARILIDALTQAGRPLRVPCHVADVAALRALSAAHHVTWKWVKAHAGNPYNERCDRMCMLARS